MTATPTTPTDPFEAHRIAMYRWAYRIVGRHHDALDVVQDVGMRWLLARDGVAAPTAWLRAATVNRAIDIVRARRSAAIAPERAESEEGEPSATADLEALRRDIATVLSRMTESQRAVLVAKVFDGLSFARIASEQGISASTAKTHYLRALRSARDTLAPRWSERQDDPLSAGARS